MRCVVVVNAAMQKRYGFTDILEELGKRVAAASQICRCSSDAKMIPIKKLKADQVGAHVTGGPEGCGALRHTPRHDTTAAY